MNPHQHPALGALLLRVFQGSVHKGRAHQAFKAAPRYADLEHIQIAHKVVHILVVLGVNFKAHQAAVARLLGFHQLILGMALQSRIVHHADAIVLFQIMGHRQSRLLMALQPGLQGAHAAQHQPALHGADNGTKGTADHADLLEELLIAGDQ